MSTIIVDRLLEFYDPAQALLGKSIWRLSEKQMLRVKPRAYAVKHTLRYHLGRIRYFYNRFVEGKPVEPIELDNDCDHGHIYGPIVTDGHHRLIGAFFAHQPTIEADYSGRVDTLRYLTGRRKTPPLI